jgi:hypothetical protein
MLTALLITVVVSFVVTLAQLCLGRAIKRL